jgi:CBS domain containing-hemolysin-like protein
MITREDLVEELVGELQDEFDEEEPLLRSMAGGSVRVRGDMLVSNLNARLEVELPEDGSHTIGGLVMDYLGRIPEVGDEVEVAGVRLRVQAVEHHAASEVSITLPFGEEE